MYKFINVFQGTFETEKKETLEYRKVNLLDKSGNVKSLKVTKDFDWKKAIETFKIGDSVNIDTELDYQNYARLSGVRKA